MYMALSCDHKNVHVFATYTIDLIEYLASSSDSSVIDSIPSRIEPVASLQGLRLSANEELRTPKC